MFSLFKLGSEKMKVFKTIFLCVVLIFALAGCGNSHAEADKTVKQGSGQKTDGAVNASEESTKGAAESATEGVQVRRAQRRRQQPSRNLTQMQAIELIMLL